MKEEQSIGAKAFAIVADQIGCTSCTRQKIISYITYDTGYFNRGSQRNINIVTAPHL
jgi:hypothetical protein